MISRHNDGTMTKTSHIVIEGSSQWLIGRNFTAKYDIIHASGNYVKLRDRSKISLKNVDMHSYEPSFIFYKEQTPVARAIRVNCSVLL